MALSLEPGNKVWQRVQAFLSAQNGGGAGISPATVGAFAALRDYLTCNKGNPPLQFVPFTEVQADDADGTGLLDAACTIYAFYVKKENNGTDSTMKLFESATVDTTSTEQSLSLPIDLANQETFQIYPNGWAQATGTTITQHTTIEGSTDSSTGADGFLIVGAA